MKVAVNAPSAVTGGAITYLVNLLRNVGAHSDDEYVLFAPRGIAHELPEAPPNVRVVWKEPMGALGRFAWDQWGLRRAVRAEKADALFNTANFALLASPVPQLVFVRTPVYFSEEFDRRIMARLPLGFRVEHAIRKRLVKWSARAAEIVLAPSEAFAETLRRAWPELAPRVRRHYHGLDAEAFAAGVGAPPERPPGEGPVLVYVSHYGWQKDFTTALRALHELRKEAPGAVLETTCEIRAGNGRRDHGNADEDAALIEELSLRPALRELGRTAYTGLGPLYARADVAIFPSWCESFGHPLVEAMAMGVPIVAADTDVNRDVAGDAALYHPVRDPAAMAAAVLRVWREPELRARLIARGKERAKDFSWQRHFDEIRTLLASLR
jgi:glycosyltransferase involved in cell wall biosynthesis